jgi:dTDP-4-dehydrorhamnose reductase
VNHALAGGGAGPLLLVGADGQVGHELARALAPLGAVVATTRRGVLPGGATCRSLDLADHAAIDALVREVRPRWLINAAAYTQVDRAEDEADLAHAINGAAPGALSRAAAAVGATVLHYSTDYVFDGSGRRPYREDDAVGPVSVYGRSKLAGEQALAESGAHHLILRTAWVYGARGHNFLRTMLRLAGEREHLRVVDDQVGAPTSARTIAAASAAIIVAHDVGDRVDRGYRERVFHLSAAGAVSWHGFASAIFARAERARLLVRVPTVEAIPTSAFPTRARRPAYSVLDNTRLHEAFGLRLPDWEAQLDDVIGDLAEARAAGTN